MLCLTMVLEGRTVLNLDSRLKSFLVTLITVSNFSRVGTLVESNFGNLVIEAAP